MNTMLISKEMMENQAYKYLIVFLIIKLKWKKQWNCIDTFQQQDIRKTNLNKTK